MRVVRVFSLFCKKKLNYGDYQPTCSVNNATLNRFFALHFVLPFVLAALALMHLIALHDTAGSSLFGPKFLYMKALSSLKTTLAFILPNFKPNTRIGPHNEQVISVIVGSLLGDGYAERLQNGGVRIRFRPWKLPGRADDDPNPVASCSMRLARYTQSQCHTQAY